MVNLVRGRGRGPEEESQPAGFRGVIPGNVRFTSLIAPALGLLLAGATWLAWRQYQELVVLRVSALGGDERAALEQRLAEFRKRNFELQSELAARQLDRQADDAAAVDPAHARDAAKESAAATLAKLTALAADEPGGESKRDEAFELLGAMADMPEFQKLLALEQRGKVDAKFAGLFRKLKLSPETQTRLETLLADKQSAFADAMIAARGQGLTGKDARQLANSVANATQKEINGSIKELLGPQGFNQYQNYERTMPQREAVNQLAQQLSYTPTPLTPRQQEQLVQVLATTAATPKTVTNAAGQSVVKSKPAQPIAALPGALASLGIGSAAAAPITTNAVAQAQNFLSPQQVAALARMQQQQQAQQTLSAVLKGKPANAAPKPPKAPKPGK
jgi:hypothetical protein